MLFRSSTQRDIVTIDQGGTDACTLVALLHARALADPVFRDGDYQRLGPGNGWRDVWRSVGGCVGARGEDSGKILAACVEEVGPVVVGMHAEVVHVHALGGVRGGRFLNGSLLTASDRTLALHFGETLSEMLEAPTFEQSASQTGAKHPIARGWGVGEELEAARQIYQVGYGIERALLDGAFIAVSYNGHARVACGVSHGHLLFVDSIGEVDARGDAHADVGKRYYDRGAAGFSVADKWSVYNSVVSYVVFPAASAA